MRHSIDPTLAEIILDDTDDKHHHPADDRPRLRVLSTTGTVAHLVIMSEGEIEVESPQGYPVLPKDVTEEIGSIKLFNKWSYEDVEIRDISLTYV